MGRAPARWGGQQGVPSLNGSEWIPFLPGKCGDLRSFSHQEEPDRIRARGTEGQGEGMFVVTGFLAVGALDGGWRVCGETSRRQGLRLGTRDRPPTSWEKGADGSGLELDSWGKSSVWRAKASV